MKLLADFLPILLFFIAYKWFGIYTATFTAIGIALLQSGINWLRYRRLEWMHLITLATLTILGGATLIFHNELFIKWKPTALNWILALVFFGSQFVGTKPLVQRLMESNVKLPDTVWQRLNLSWVGFFFILGTSNLYVAYYFDTDTWVNFKLFGILGATLIFIVLQAIYLTKHVDEDNNDPVM